MSEKVPYYAAEMPITGGTSIGHGGYAKSFVELTAVRRNDQLIDRLHLSSGSINLSTANKIH